MEAKEDAVDETAALRKELAALRRDFDQMRARPRIDDDSTRYGTVSIRGDDDDEAADLTPKTAKRLEKATEECEVEASMWDSSVFAYTTVTGTFGSVYYTILFLANVVMQLSFIGIIWWGLFDPPIDREDVNDIKSWRRQIAHAIRYYDTAGGDGGESLARRVCEQDFGLEVSGFQASLYSSLVAYLGPLNSSRGIGTYLCMLALAMWAMVLAKDVNEAINMAGALLCIPRGTTKIVINRNGQVIIEELSVARVVAAVGVQVLRMVVAAGLAYVGCVYLARTIDPGDLILNAVALEFILNADNLIFTCFAPKRFRALVKHAKTLASPPFLPSRKGLNAGAICSIGVTMIGLTALYLALVHPQEKMLRNAQDAMCAGDLDFIYSVDAMGLPHWARTKKGEREADTLEKRNFPDGESRSHLYDKDPLEIYDTEKQGKLTYVERVVDTVVKQYGRNYFQNPCEASICNNYTILGPDYPIVAFPDLPTCCIPAKTKLADASLVISKARMPLEAVVQEINPASFDIIDTPMAGTYTLRLAISSLVSTKPCGGCSLAKPFCIKENQTCVEPDCVTLKPFCNDVTDLGRRTRGVCSVTCACVVPQSGLALSQPEEGCGKVINSGVTREYLGRLPCEDVANDDPSWLEFLDNAELAAQSQPLDTKTWSNKGISYFRKYGCSYLSNTSLWDNMTTYDAWLKSAPEPGTSRSPYFLGDNPCVRGGTFTKPLSLFCPVACGCRRGDQDCPTQCPERNETTPLCPSWHEEVFPGLRWCAQLPNARTFDQAPGGGPPLEGPPPDGRYVSYADDWVDDAPRHQN